MYANVGMISTRLGRRADAWNKEGGLAALPCVKKPGLVCLGLYVGPCCADEKGENAAADQETGDY